MLLWCEHSGACLWQSTGVSTERLKVVPYTAGVCCICIYKYKYNTSNDEHKCPTPYLGLIQTTQGLQKVSQIRPNTVKVLRGDTL